MTLHVPRSEPNKKQSCPFYWRGPVRQSQEAVLVDWLPLLLLFLLSRLRRETCFKIDGDLGDYLEEQIAVVHLLQLAVDSTYLWWRCNQLVHVGLVSTWDWMARCRGLGRVCL